MKLPEEIQFIANSRMPQKTTDARLDGQVCVITGATSGVGYQIAKRLAEAGAHLILVNRNDKKARRVRDEITNQHNIQVDLVQADFSNLDDVRDAATKILSQYSAINVLINNAGLHLTRRTLTAAGYETVFCVNHLASFLFTRLLLFIPIFVATAPGCTALIVTPLPFNLSAISQTVRSWAVLDAP